MFQGRSLRDLVPEVLNVPVPEGSNQCLFLGAGCARNETQTLDFIENPCVLLARQPRWRCGTKFISARQSERSYLRPLGEVRCWEIGRRELVVSRLVCWDKSRRSDVRSVDAAGR